jgi:hypothetical protein
MNGIYLNDIPMDLFLEYFTKQDLAKRRLTPVLDNYSATVDLFTITIDGDEYYYKTSFTRNFTDDSAALLSITDDINDAFNDIFEDGILSETYTFVRASQPSSQIYRNPLTGYVYPYKYRLETISVGNYHFIELPSEVFPLTDVSLNDARTGTNIYGTTIVTIKENNGDYRIEETSTGNLLGYLKINDFFQTQKIDSGKYMFVDEFNNETSTEYVDSKFLKHNNIIRVGLNGLIDKKDLIYVSFNPSTIGILQEGTKDKLTMFEKFTKTTTYSIPSTTPTSFNDDLLDSVLMAKVITDPVTEPMVFTKDIIDFSKLPVVKTKIGEYTGNSRKSKLLSNYYGVSVNTGENVIIEEYKEKVVLRETDYELSSTNTINYNDTSVEIIVSPFLQAFAVIPVVKEADLKYYVNIYENGSFKRYYFVKNTGAPNFELSEKIDSAIYTMQLSTPVYQHGYIKLPCKIKSYPNYDKQYFGTVSAYSSLNKEITILKYSPTPSNVPILLPDVMDVSSYTLVGGVYTRTIFYRDILDRTLFLEVKEDIAKDSVSAVPEYAEFINYNHSTSSGSDQFIIRAGTKYEKTVYRTTDEISRPLDMDTFKANFSQFNHSVSNSYLSKRGNLVDSNVVYDIKRKLFGEMISEYASLNYTNFYAITNIVYSVNNTIKMRVFIDGLQNLLKNDPERLYPITRRKELLTYNDIDTSIVLRQNTDAPELEYIVGRDYDVNIGAGYAQSELSKLNAFQKLIDYENFSSDEARKDYLLKKYVRDYSYNDKDTTVSAPDDMVGYNLAPPVNKIRRIDFKSNLISLLSGYYADFNSTPEDDKYTADYFKNIKSKIDNTPVNTSVNSNDKVYYKKVYSGEYRGTNAAYEKELIKNILNKDEKWEAE